MNPVLIVNQSTGVGMTPYTRAAFARTQHLELVRNHALGWRLAASASAMLCIGLAAVFSMTISRPAVAIHIFEIDRSAHNPVDRGRLSGERVDHLPGLESARSADDAPWRSPHFIGPAFPR